MKYCSPVGMKVPYFTITQKQFHFYEEFIFAKNTNWHFWLVVLMSENSILYTFFCNILFFSGDTILHKEPQDSNTNGLAVQKHVFKNASKTFPFTAILKLATRSYERPTLQEKTKPQTEKPCNLEPWLLFLPTWAEKSVFDKHTPVPHMAVLFSSSAAFLTLQHHKGKELCPLTHFSSSLANYTRQNY